MGRRCSPILRKIGGLFKLTFRELINIFNKSAKIRQILGSSASNCLSNFQLKTQVGLETMLEKCPRFKAWIETLIELINQ